MRIPQVGAAAVATAALALLSASGPPLRSVASDVQPHPRPASVLLLGTVPAQISFDDLAPTEAAALARAGSAVALVATSTTSPVRPPREGVVGSSPPAGTPQAVLAAAYRRAVSRAPAGCHLHVAHLAAIGQVESGSIGGRSVTSDHRVTPAIYGPLLDGGPFAVVRDSDDGAYDGAGDYDRAMGPLQFLPGTWSWAGRDGDGDGRRDPQNVFDAASATADYLCRGGRDLARSGHLRAAVLSYNQSGPYHSAVLEWVSYFERHGLAALTTVAFRVGSGGRASAMTAPEPDRSPPTTAPSPTPTTSAKPAGPGPAQRGAPRTPAIPATTPTTGVPAIPTPHPSAEPSSDPTTSQPSTTTPAPVDPDPTPSTSTGVDDTPP